MKNLRLMIKLVGGFLVVALITLTVGLVGWFGVENIHEGLTNVGLVRMPSVENLLIIAKEAESIRVAQRTMLSPTLDRQGREQQVGNIAMARERYTAAWNVYEPFQKTPQEEELWKQFIPAWKEWAVENNKFMDYSNQLLKGDILNPTDLRKNFEIFRGDHYKLETQACESIATGKNFEGGTDPKACNFGKWMADFKTDNPDLMAIVEELQVPHDDFHASVGTLKQLTAAGNTEGASRTLKTEVIPAAEKVFDGFRKIRELAGESEALYAKMTEQAMVKAKEKQDVALEFLNQIVELNRDLAHEEVKTSDVAATSASLTSIIGMAAGTLIAILLGVFLAKSITSPVLKGVALAKSLSTGDLSQSIDVNQKDEVGVLADALKQMNRKLREVVGEVLAATDNLASGSEQLSSAAEGLSQGATEQAASIEEVSSSMEEMTSNIKQNADNAQTTEGMAAKAAKDAEQGGNAVTQTVDSMKQIAEKISIIEEIARQTNLLALNAAIEAARAGEHGKGFAVVAAEVRKLAERSGEAASEISELSTTSVEVAEQAGKMIRDIVPDIKKTAELVQEIAAASSEQNAGAEQINKAIQQLDLVVQQNASAAEQMASTSSELAGQGQQLQQTMSFFNLNEGRRANKYVVRPAQPKRLEAAQPPPRKNGLDLNMNEDADDDFESF